MASKTNNPKIATYLDDLMDKKLIKPELYNQAREDAQNMGDSPEWVKKWGSKFKSDPYLSDSYLGSGIDDLSKTLPERLRKYFAESGFQPDENWKSTVYQTHFTDIPKNKFDEAISQMKGYYDQYKTERNEEAGKIRRAREIREEWPWYKNLAVSDYEKERYINDPKSATVGKEEEGSGGFRNSSIGSKLDLGAGIAGFLADFVPGPGALIGPTIRGARDAAYYLSDSPYKKSGDEMAKDLAFDYSTNIAAWSLPNARKLGRIGRALLGKEADKYVQLADMTKNIQEGMNLLDAAPARDIYRTRQAIEAMPESPFKSELMSATSDWGKGKIDWEELLNIQNKYARDLDATKKNLVQIPEAISTVEERGYKVDAGLTPYGEKKALSPEFSDLSKGSKIEVGVSKLADQINKGKVGQILTQQALSFKRGSGPENKTKRPSFKEAKEFYKKNFARDWELGFDPRKQEYDDPRVTQDPAMIAAYEEWLDENNPYKKWGTRFDGR
jgi:hypothetical protein